MSIATTLVVPPALFALYRRSPEPGASAVVTRDISEELELADEGGGHALDVETGIDQPG
jgi:hypothetical protein